MKIYLAVQDYDHEGSSIEGVYTNLRQALNHQFNGGDDQRIEVWNIGKNGVGVRKENDLHAAIKAIKAREDR